jgi:multisubunit Na+/H+ antiporter MnhC subunit
MDQLIELLNTVDGLPKALVLSAIILGVAYLAGKLFE